MSSSRVASQLEPWSELKGKTIMVTGASSGIGREFCLDLARAGCNILAAARRVDRLKSLCDEINQLAATSKDGSIRAVPVELDIGSVGSTIEAAVKKAWAVFGRIDILINNAGLRGGVHTPLDLSENDWNYTFKTNLTGAFLVSKYVCILMRDAKLGGSIINISSISGLNRGESPGGLAYVTSKAGVNTMTKVMAVELGAYNIRVNSIGPGIFKSEITESLMQKEWLKNVAKKTVPLGTWGIIDPALTSLVRYLVHDSSRYVSGNVFIVDGGATLPGVPIFSSL